MVDILTNKALGYCYKKLDIYGYLTKKHIQEIAEQTVIIHTELTCGEKIKTIYAVESKLLKFFNIEKEVF